MKKIFALCAMLLMAVGAQAQAPMFAEGDQVATLGIGLGSGKTYGVPITVSYDRGFMNLNDKSTIGLGGLISYAGKGYDTAGYFDKVKYSSLTLAATGTYHYDLVDNFDLFGALSIGYVMGQSAYKVNDSKATVAANEFFIGIGVGARYYFTDTIGAYAKIGYATTSFLEIGAAYRF